MLTGDQDENELPSGVSGIMNNPNPNKGAYDRANPAKKRTVDRMVAQVMLKCSNVSPADKRKARQTLKQLRTTSTTSEKV